MKIYIIGYTIKSLVSIDAEDHLHKMLPNTLHVLGSRWLKPKAGEVLYTAPTI